MNTTTENTNSNSMLVYEHNGMKAFFEMSYFKYFTPYDFERFGKELDKFQSDFWKCAEGGEDWSTTCDDYEQYIKDCFSEYKYLKEVEQ